jgi:protein-disulfide isomerase
MFTLATRSPGLGPQPIAQERNAMLLSRRRHLLPLLLFGVLLLLFAVEAASADETHPVPQATLAALLAGPLATPPQGAPRADVTIVEYFDYNCPGCRELDPRLNKLLAADPNVRLVRKDWAIFGDGSVYAAYASYAAASEGRYQAAHQALITSSKDLNSKADVLAVLKAAGFDTAKINADVAGHEKEYSGVLARDAREAASLGLQGTPGLIVGNQLVLGPVTYRRLERLVAAARERRPS